MGLLGNPEDSLFRKPWGPHLGVTWPSWLYLQCGRQRQLPSVSRWAPFWHLKVNKAPLIPWGKELQNIFQAGVTMMVGMCEIICSQIPLRAQWSNGNHLCDFSSFHLPVGFLHSDSRPHWPHNYPFSLLVAPFSTIQQWLKAKGHSMHRLKSIWGPLACPSTGNHHYSLFKIISLKGLLNKVQMLQY